MHARSGHGRRRGGLRMIDDETTIQLSDALRAGSTTIRECFSLLDAPACERIRARDVLGQRRRRSMIPKPDLSEVSVYARRK